MKRNVSPAGLSFNRIATINSFAVGNAFAVNTTGMARRKMMDVRYIYAFSVGLEFSSIFLLEKRRKSGRILFAQIVNNHILKDKKIPAYKAGILF